MALEISLQTLSFGFQVSVCGYGLVVDGHSFEYVRNPVPLVKCDGGPPDIVLHEYDALCQVTMQYKMQMVVHQDESKYDHFVLH